MRRDVARLVAVVFAALALALAVSAMVGTVWRSGGAVLARSQRQQQRLAMLYDYDYVCRYWGCWDTGAGLKMRTDESGVMKNEGGQIPYFPFATHTQHEANWNQYFDSEEMQSFEAKEQEFQDYLLKSTYYDVAASREADLGDWGMPYNNLLVIPPDGVGVMEGVQDENGIVADDGVNMAYAEY